MMGKNELKRAAAKHSQNVADMFKRRNSSPVTVSSSPVSTSAVTISSSPVSTSAVTVSSSPVSTSAVTVSSSFNSEIHGKQSTDASKPAAIERPFQPNDPTYNFPLRSWKEAKALQS